MPDGTQLVVETTPAVLHLTIPAPGSASSQTTSQMPSFADLWNNYPTYLQYPTEIGDNSIWNLIQGKVADNGNAGIFANSCAIRLSYALNYSDALIPQASQTSSGGNGFQYYYRVSALTDYLTNTYGEPSEYDPSSWMSDLAGQTGIVLFKVPFRNGPTGHFELFNGTNIINSTDPNNNHDYSVQATKIYFWPVK